MSRPKKGEQGCKEANDKWRKTMIEKYGGVTEFMREVGRKGGSKSHRETRPFTVNPELARAAGAKGGKMSKRGPNKQPRKKKQVETKPTVEVDKKKKGILGWFSGRRNG